MNNMMEDDSAMYYRQQMDPQMQYSQMQYYYGNNLQQQLYANHAHQGLTFERFGSPPAVGISPIMMQTPLQYYQAQQMNGKNNF